MRSFMRGVLISVADALLRHAERRRDRSRRADWLFWGEMRIANVLADAATKLLPPGSTRGTRPSNSKGPRDV